MKITTLLIAGLLFSSVMFAQKGVEDGSKYGHGEDSIRCLENLSLYSEYYKQNNIKEAYPYWEIVFNECPASSMNIYSHGERMVQAMYKGTKDAAKKDELYSLLMKIYDQRIKYFGTHKKYPTAYINGKKAVSMLTYKRDDTEVIKEAHALLKESVGIRTSKTQSAVLMSYMMSSVAMYKMDALSGEDLVNTYTQVTDILDAKKKTSKKPEVIDEQKKQVESLFAQSGAANCEVLSNIFAPQLADHTQDLDWLKRVNRLLARGDCTESDLFYKSSEHLHVIEPSASSAFGLAQMYMKRKEMDRAVGYFQEAITLEEDDETKAKYHHYIGLIYMSQGKFAQVRSEAKKAIALRSDWGAPYILIGKAYASAASKYGSNEFEHKTVYWAAVDQFKKAKSVDAEMAAEANDLIVMYSQYFPGTEEIFFNTLQVGAAYKIEGWINVQTTVRAKK
ncbi:tetratricopeptide repeat protein [Marinilabiliaceae bacterium N1Y90]|nr:tetratricopeptide repeat protein [Marinilabiliaceae bacterium N1Y90]